jgi:hypothetical protein
MIIETMNEAILSFISGNICFEFWFSVVICSLRKKRDAYLFTLQAGMNFIHDLEDGYFPSELQVGNSCQLYVTFGSFL